MPVPTTIADLSTTAASNFPSGSDSPASLDDVQRAHGAFIAQLRDGAHVPSATAKTTPVDADLIPINDSAASNIIKKLTWGNAKATLKTYFDTLYAAVGSFAASGANNDITSLSALTNGIVGTSGNQTIAGTKTFSTQPVLPNAPSLRTLTATASGTGVEFTSIPAWVKKITVMMHGTSTNGSSNLRFQIGPSGGVETSGYLSSSAIGATYGLDSGGFSLTTSITSSSISSGIATFVLMDSATNLWAYSSNLGYSNAAGASYAGGSKALAGTLSRLKLTTVNGADTFDAGSINILWE